MEAIASISFATSIIQTIDVVVRTIDSLRKLQVRWKSTDFTVAQLIGHLATLKAALNQISNWVSGNAGRCPQNDQLTTDLEASMESCHTLVSFMEDFLSNLCWNECDNLTFESKTRALLQDAKVKECQSHLSHQATALNLLLTALNCQSLSKQNEIMECRQTRQILEQVKDDTSSLIVLRDTSSYYSSRATDTPNSSLLDRKFSFDSEVLRSKVYQGQIRSLIRRALPRRKTTHKIDASTPRRFIYDCGIYVRDGRFYSVRRARFDSDAQANFILSSVCSQLSLRITKFPDGENYSCIDTWHHQGESTSHYAKPEWCLDNSLIDLRDDVKFIVVDEMPKMKLQMMEEVLLFRQRQDQTVDVGKRELVPVPRSSYSPPSIQPWKNVDMVLKAALLPSSTRKNLRFRTSRIEPSTLGGGRYMDGMVVWNGASMLSKSHSDGEGHNPRQSSNQCSEPSTRSVVNHTRAWTLNQDGPMD